MALITDPDSLNQATEIVIDTVNKEIELLIAGNLSTDGVTLQALYSFLKEEWKDTTLIQYPFPMEAITPEQFEFKDGWIPKNKATVDLFRNGGFAIKAIGGATRAEWFGAVTLGSVGATDQVYYQQEVDGASTDIVLQGAVNQCVQFSSDGGDTDWFDVTTYDYSGYFKIFVREQAKIYAQSSNTDIGVSTFTYQAYRFPLANSDDLKVTESDVTVDAYGVTIEYFGVAQSRTIGAGSYDFDIIIDGNNRTTEEIYMAVQSALRKNSDIDNGAGNVVGKTADGLLSFVGDTLVTATGVYIDNFLTEDTNSIEFFDNTGTKRVFPFVSAGTINFNDNLVSDGNAVYKMYYTSGFGTAGATLVLDNNDNPIEGTISGSSVSFDYDYDNDTAGGGAGIDKDVTVVAIGLGSAQYVVTTGTIAKTNANSISLVSSLERNYSNPA
jgi:hypothetical protein